MGNCSGKPADAVHPRGVVEDAPQDAPVDQRPVVANDDLAR